MQDLVKISLILQLENSFLWDPAGLYVLFSVIALITAWSLLRVLVGGYTNLVLSTQFWFQHCFWKFPSLTPCHLVGLPSNIKFLPSQDWVGKIQAWLQSDYAIILGSVIGSWMNNDPSMTNQSSSLNFFIYRYKGDSLSLDVNWKSLTVKLVLFIPPNLQRGLGA